MNIRNVLTRLSASCFPADLPDHDRTVLRLLRDGGGGMQLLLRLAVSALLMAAGLFFEAGGVLWYLILCAAALLAGYDYLAAAVLCILEKKPLSNALWLSVCLIAAVAAGAPIEAAAFMILYRILTLLAGYVTDRTVQALSDAAGGELHSPAELPAPRWSGWILPVALVLTAAVFLVRLLLGGADAAAAVHSALCVLVIASPFSLLAAGPLTWYCGVNGAATCNVLFRSCHAMQSFAAVRSIALDMNGGAEGDLPKLVSIKSEKLPPELLLELVAHAESCSKSRTARAILAAYTGKLQPELITNALDIPGSGTEVYLRGMRICVGTRELMILKGVSIPDEDLTEDYVIYVSVADQYAGKLLLREAANTDAEPAVQDLRSGGVQSVVLFSNAQNESVSEVARALSAEQLFCKCTEEEKAEILSNLQNDLPEGQALLYVLRGCTAHPCHSPAALDVCMISEDNGGQFDADALIMDGDLRLIPDAIEAAAWIRMLCREALLLTGGAKLLLIVLAFLGIGTVWFSVVLDGAAALGTLLLSIRAYGFDKPHPRLQDYLPHREA